MMRSAQWILGGLFSALFGCSSTVDVQVRLEDPCNRVGTIASMDFLRLEPRGLGVDTEGLSTILAVNEGGSPGIAIPLTENFQMVVTGHRGNYDQPIAGIGASARYDLTRVDSDLEVVVPFAGVDGFYRTTDLSQPTRCTGLSVSRYGASATYLPQIDRVLILGGLQIIAGTNQVEIAYPRTVELFDPNTGRFSVVEDLPIGTERAFHTATRLSDGRVLVVGGEARVNDAQAALLSAFIVDANDPARVTFEVVQRLREPRVGHTSLLLDDGRVLVAGGRDLVSGGRPQDHHYSGTVEVFDPEQGIFLYLNDDRGNRLEVAPRYGHSATTIGTANGVHEILLAGGMNEDGAVTRIDLLRLVGPQALVVSVEDGLGAGAIFHSAASTEDGRVLLSGGYARMQDAEPGSALPRNPSNVVEIWEVVEGVPQRTCTGQLATARGFHTSAMVDGRAIFVGGRREDGSSLETSETAQIATGPSCFAQSPTLQTMDQARNRHTMVHLPNSNELLVVGGHQQEIFTDPGRSLDVVEVFSPARRP